MNVKIAGDKFNLRSNTKHEQSSMTKSMTDKEYLIFMKEKSKFSTHRNLIQSKCGLIEYGKKYQLIYDKQDDDGRRDWFIFNKTVIYTLQHLLQLYAGLVRVGYAVDDKIDANELISKMDNMTWDDVLDYREYLGGFTEWKILERTAIGIIYIFLELILSLNARDKHVIYSACYETWHCCYEDAAYYWKEPGCFIVFETDLKAKLLNEIKCGPTAEEDSDSEEDEDEEEDDEDEDEEEEEDF